VFELSKEAAEDVAAILSEAMQSGGAAGAVRMACPLDAKFRAIATGLVPGHRRSDIEASIPLRFAIEYPFVIAFDPASRRIVRALHGRRDFSTIFPGD
jgi:plasmid stabilization system protein ParE